MLNKAFAIILIGSLLVGCTANSPTPNTTGNTTGTTSTSNPPVTPPTTPPTGTITQAQLAQNNGKDGKDCWVAVDGTVYAVFDSSLWVNGEHTTSGGRAFCGMDLSNVIGLSPHGRSKLQLLEVVGQLSI
jgi:predicted heme/steroid binding protein